MRMPSLFKYFVVVGSVLAGLLLLANHILGPGEAGKAIAAVTPKIAVKHDPHASAVERWRDEQAALKAAAQAQTAENASVAAKSEAAPPSKAGQASAVAVPAVAEPQPVQTQPAALTQDDNAAAEEAARATKLAEEKAKADVKAARAKAQKARVARAKARAAQQQAAGNDGFYGQTRERSASNQQDQFYYAQRGGQRTAQQGPGYAYAPQQSFGPFGRGW